MCALAYVCQEAVAHFREAFGVCISWEDFMDLGDRKNLLTDALKSLDERHLPSKNCSGSLLGSLLMQHNAVSGVSLPLCVPKHNLF